MIAAMTVLEKALRDGSLRAGDVLHSPSVAEWTVCAQVRRASAATRDHEGSVVYDLFRNSNGLYDAAGGGELTQRGFAEALAHGRLLPRT